VKNFQQRKQFRNCCCFLFLGESNETNTSLRIFPKNKTIDLFFFLSKRRHKGKLYGVLISLLSQITFKLVYLSLFLPLSLSLTLPLSPISPSLSYSLSLSLSDSLSLSLSCTQNTDHTPNVTDKQENVSFSQYNLDNGSPTYVNAPLHPSHSIHFFFWSQFHQRYTSEFFADILAPKNCKPKLN